MWKLDAALAKISPIALSAFRLVLGLLFTVHATQKLFAWPVGTMTQSGTLAGPPVPIGAWPFWWAGLIELVVGVLLVVGLVTRLAAFVGSGEMAVAYFTQHLPKSLWPIENGGELAVVNCFGLLLLVFLGGGAFALDAVRSNDRANAPRRRRRRAR